jgi:hypothetical protein
MKTRLLPLALALLLAAPAAAGPVVETEPLAPALGLLQTAPGFEAAVLGQLQLVSSLSGQPAAAISLAPLAAAAAAPAPPADPWRPEAARLVGALVTQPAALQENKTALRAALGEKTYARLAQSARRLAAKSAANPALAEQLGGVRRELDLSDASSVAALSARLNVLFENSRAAAEASGAPAVAAPEGPAREPLVALVPSGAAPAMTPAELAAYVAEHEVVTPRGMKKVNFASGDYEPRYDAELRRLGVDVVVIKTPSRAELARFSEADGYHLKSEYERWVMTTRTIAEQEEALGKASRVRQFKNQLEASANVPIKVGPLTVADYEAWYPIYEDEVVGKPGGKRNVGPDFAAKLAAKGELDGKSGWYGLFYYDPKERSKMVGGVIMKAWPERGMFVLGYAAYRPELKDASPSVRTFAESMKLARSLGFKVLSFGQDTNLFGYDYSLGLMSNKAGFLLTPYPEDEIVLMKVLDDAKFASVQNKQGKTAGYFFFGIKRDSPVAERYLASRDAGHPKEAQDLLGSDRYFDGKVTPAKDVVIGRRFAGDDPNPLRVPVGIDVVDAPMGSRGG